MAEIIDDDELQVESSPKGDERRGVARIEAFSDGVFAIAITLLVLGIEVPRGVPEGDIDKVIGGLDQDIFAFVLGFVVIGLFWAAHHSFFGDVERHSGALLWGNLLILLLIAAMPFSAELMGEYGETRTATVIYAANVCLAWFANLLLDWIAVRDGLLNPRSRLLTEGWIRPWEMAMPLAFGLSIPVAFVSVEAAQWMWALSLLSIRDR